MTTVAERLEVLWPPEDDVEVYAVIDGAANETLFPRLEDSGLPHASLFAGELPYALASAAPYLVHLSKESAYAHWLLDQGWEKAWGIFLRTKAPFKQVRRQLRRYLKVKTERGSQLFFRFYDPRILSRYLPTCTAAEWDYVFGPISCFFTEAGDGMLLEHTWDGRDYAQTPHFEPPPPLARPAEPALAERLPVVEFLAEHYSSGADAHALWEATGESVAFDEAAAAQERWEALWATALEHDIRVPVRMLRAALIAHPGAAPVLEALEALALEDNASSLQVASGVVEGWATRLESLTANSVEDGLAELTATTAEGAFCALAPHLQGLLYADGRARLKTLLATTSLLAYARTSLQTLLDRASSEYAPPDLRLEAKAALDGIVDRASAPALENDADAIELRGDVSARRERLLDRARLSPAVLRSAIRTLKSRLRFTVIDVPHQRRVAVLADGALAALAGTTGR